MLSVFFVLTVTIGTINIANYVVIENNTQATLTEIIKEGTEDVPPGPQGEKEKNKVDLRQEHYFVVSFNANGQIVKTNNRHMFILTEKECNDLAIKIFAGQLKGGKYGNYRYTKALKDDGLTYVAVNDIKEKLDTFKNTMLLSSLISIGAYLVLFGLILLGSKLVFKPTEEAYKNQKRFITNASHELKTPLTVISADVDLIELENGKSEWSQSIKDQVKRLNEMTNQLVTLSRLEEEDKNRFPFEDFSLVEVCNKAIDAFSASFKKEGINFSYNIASNVTMYGNKYLIDELIYIFLDNSLKYTGGENKSSYFVVSQDAKGKIEFRFSNTINKDDEMDVRQLMDRFYRSPSNKKEGSGVGLSIAEEIVKLHKGKTQIDKNNNSLTFIITFDK